MRQVKLSELHKEINIRFEAVTGDINTVLGYIKRPDCFVGADAGFFFWSAAEAGFPLSWVSKKDRDYFDAHNYERIEVEVDVDVDRKETQETQDFQTIADIWAWLFAQEGNAIKSSPIGESYVLKNGQVVRLNHPERNALGKFTKPRDYSKVIPWQANLSKEKPLLCWVGETEELVQKKWTIARVVGNHSGRYVDSKGLGWRYREPLSPKELLAFLGTYREVVCG